MTQRLPDPWEHKSGYHLNGDGSSIKYRNPETGDEIIVEAGVNEDIGEMEYIVFAFTDGKDSLKHPSINGSKPQAWDTAAEWASELS